MRRAPLLFTLVCLAGCSSSTGSPTVPTTSATDAALESARASAAAVTTLPDGSSGALDDLTRTQCTRKGDGPYSFTGRLTNGTSTPATYHVTVSVVDAKTFAVQGSKAFTQRVAPKGSVDLTAPDFATPRGDTQCVIRVTRKAG